MHTLKTLLEFIATEAFEGRPDNEVDRRQGNNLEEEASSSLQYDAELIRCPDGTLRWVQ